MKMKKLIEDVETQKIKQKGTESAQKSILEAVDIDNERTTKDEF